MRYRRYVGTRKSQRRCGFLLLRDSLPARVSNPRRAAGIESRTLKLPHLQHYARADRVHLGIWIKNRPTF